MRIAVIMGNYPPAERQRRVDTILSYSGEGITMGFVEVGPSPYARGFGAQAAAQAIPTFVAACVQAEREGYDAVVPLGVLDIGLQQGREAVDIPVLGAFESALHMAALLGARVGVIAYNTALLPILRDLAARYGMERLVCGYEDVGIELPDLAAASDRLEDEFCAAASRLQANSQADVIVAAGISICPVHVTKDALEKRLRLPVVEAIGAPIQMAHALVRLGLRHSRRWRPAS